MSTDTPSERPVEERPAAPEAPSERPPEESAAPPESPPPEPAPAHAPHRGTGALRVLAILVVVSGVILMVAGAVTWGVVTTQLSDEDITVSDDADNFAGDPVDGPLTAYAQAEVINDHALEESDGLTYAELDRDDPRRDTVMTASFLRASLFTSVVSFGVAAFAFGMGVLMILLGWALLKVDKLLRTPVV